MENWLGQNSFIGVWITLEDGKMEQVNAIYMPWPRLQIVFMHQNYPAYSYALFAFQYFWLSATIWSGVRET